VLGVFNTNPAVLEVATRIAIYGGGVGSPAPWKAGGRTGAATVTFCPGDVVTPSGNPGCPGGIAGGPINGLMTYTKTAAQFGGPGQSSLKGFVTVALFGGGTVPAPNTMTPPPPGTVTALFALANPSTKGAGGAPFGFVNATTGAPPGAGLGAGVFSVLTNGQLLAKIGSVAGSGVSNPGTEYGAPWTTGRVTVQVTAVAALPETFTLTGSDMRVGGVGNISLVAGSVSTRLISSGQANRAWTNLTIGEMIVPTPSMSSHSLAAVFGLLALAGGYVLDRRRRVRS